MTTAVSFRDVDIIFGRRTREAIELLDRGESRGAILEKTGAVLGVAGATLDVGEGEICVLMGLSGSGKSTLLRAVNGLNQPVRGGVPGSGSSWPASIPPSGAPAWHSSSSSSGSTNGPTNMPMSCRAACSSGSAWRGPSPPTHRSS